MNDLNLKSLVLTNGIVGLIGGIILLFGGWFILFAVAAGEGVLNFMQVFLFLIKIACLVLGVIGSVKFKATDKVTTAPNVLLIVGGALAIIPLLGWVGGIIIIVGGALYLASLKKFV